MRNVNWDANFDLPSSTKKKNKPDFITSFVKENALGKLKCCYEDYNYNQLSNKADLDQLQRGNFKSSQKIYDLQLFVRIFNERFLCWYWNRFQSNVSVLEVLHFELRFLINYEVNFSRFSFSLTTELNPRLVIYFR